MKTRFVKVAAVLAACSALVVIQPAWAGSFSTTPFTSDATSGVSPASSYTHLLDFGGGGASVNGVVFSGAPSQLGSNYVITGAPNLLGDGSFNTPPFNVTVPVGDGFNQMFKSFFYGGPTEQVGLFNLTPGLTYSTRFYSDPWGGPRTQDVTSNGNRIQYDEDSVTQYLEYVFTATDTKNVVQFQQTGPGSEHQYVLSNEVLPVAPRALPFVRAPGLYNTGVGNNGVPLLNASGVGDPHYVLSTNPDTGNPMPVVQDETAFPIVGGPWLANNATSKWIGPQFNTSGSAGGVYVYDLSFDLTGIDETQFQIRGSWATDNTHGAPYGIFLNGAPVAGTQDLRQFDSFVPFTVAKGSGFLPGANTLTFVLENQGAGYNGLRVDGLRGLAPAPGAEWIADLFSTGVDNAGVPLPSGAADPHWNIIASSDPGYPGGPAVVQQNHPAWAENGTGSSWISTTALGTTNIPEGPYVFETSFTIPANLDPTSAIILGRFAADNQIDEVYLNGLPLGISYSGFSALTDFTIDGGFVSGTNTLTVLVSNFGPGDNPGGFRMEFDGFAYQIPEPSTLALVALALGGALVAGWRGRRGR